MKIRKEEKMKKLLVFIISIAMVMSLIPMTAFAETGLTARALGNTTVYTGNKQDFTKFIEVKYNGSNVEEGKYELKWTDPEGKPCTQAELPGTYTGTIKHTPEGGTEQTTTIEYKVDKVNMAATDFKVEYKGPTDMTDTFKGIKLYADASAVFSKDYLNITQNGVKIDNKLFNATAIKKNDYQFEVTLTSLSQYVYSSSKTLMVSMTTVFSDARFKIVGGVYNSDDIANVVYNGAEQKPYVYVVPATNAVGSKSGALRLDYDYKLKYTSNIKAGTATVEATSKDGSPYGKGTISKTFTIEPKDIKYASISFPANSISGEKPLFTVRDGSNVLAEGSDFTVKSHTNVAGSTTQGELVVEGIGNYKGSLSGRYTMATNNIAGADVVQWADANTQFTGSTIYPPMPKLTYGTGSTLKTLYLNSDYTLEYRYDGNMATTTPKDAKVYDVYALGRGSFGGEKKVGNFTIAKIPFVEISGVTVSVTQGAAQTKPTVVIKTKAGATLVEGADKDYTFTYNFYKELGRGKVTITSTGRGNVLGGTIVKDYVVASKSLPYAYFYEYSAGAYRTTTSKTVTWNGMTVSVPTIRVMDGTSLLTEGLHYTTTVKDAAGRVVGLIKDTGTYYVTVTGIGMYTGTQTLTITVLGQSITGYTVTLKEDVVKHDGLAKNPNIIAVKSGTKILTSSDYTVSYQDQAGKPVTTLRDAGIYKVILTGKGGYQDTTSVDFRIKGLDQTISGIKSSYKTKTLGDTITLSPTANGDGKGFTYASSDTTVATVSTTGVVTPGKMGRAVVTISTTGTSKYDPAATKVIIKVFPKKSYLTKKPWSVSNGKIKVRWDKQDGTTKYQIRYSRTANFQTGNYATKTVKAAMNSYTTQSTSVRGLVPGKRYYIQVRAVKEVQNEAGKIMNYNGLWSHWKTVVVR